MVGDDKGRVMSKDKMCNTRYYFRDIVKKLGMESMPVSFGAEKRCFIFKDFVIFATPVESKDKQNISDLLLTRLVKQQNAEYLKSCGINTPEIVDIQFENDNIFEIQQRAPGSVLGFSNQANAISCLLGKDYPVHSIAYIESETKNILGNKILNYHIKMQKLLKNAELKQIAKFVKDFWDIEKFGLDLDVHLENFLYDKEKGFYFIDLPSVQSSQEKMFSIEKLDSGEYCASKQSGQVKEFKHVELKTVVFQICNLIKGYEKFCMLFGDNPKTKVVEANCSAIISRIFLALEKSNIAIDKKDLESLKQMFLENNDLQKDFFKKD